MFLMIGMFFISLGSAEGTLGTFKQRDCVSLYQNCNDCTYVNLTKITFPNGTLQIINSAMTKDDIDYSYTYCTTSDLGTYYYTVKGDKGGSTKTERISFEVTPSGFANTLGFHILILILSLGLIIFGIGIADVTITILGSFGLYFLGFWILFNGLDGIKDTTYTWAIGLIVLGIAFYVSFKSAYELITD